jgi:DNA-binding NarL/FixJ family response regulator
MDRIRIYLADDHEIVRDGLKALVNAQPDMEVVGEAGDGCKAVDEILGLHPDVVVLDLSLPGLDGGQVADRLRAECPEVRVLALTVHEDKGYLHRLLGAGAAGYILKRAASVELGHAIRIVARGGTYLDPNLAGRLVGELLQKPPAAGTTRDEVLSGREREVVRLIAMGFGNREIAAQLEISVKTVETHRTRALEKLGVENRAGLVRYALQRGWLQEN